MKNLFTIALLFIAGLAFAQPVRTTITDDGVNVTVQTPVNIKVIPICDFHWVFVDGQLRMWIEGGNELIPGGRLGNFTINGATTQQAKLDALGAISAQCSGGGDAGVSTNGDSAGNGCFILSDAPSGQGNWVFTKTAGVGEFIQNLPGSRLFSGTIAGDIFDSYYSYGASSTCFKLVLPVPYSMTNTDYTTALLPIVECYGQIIGRNPTEYDPWAKDAQQVPIFITDIGSGTVTFIFYGIGDELDNWVINFEIP